MSETRDETPTDRLRTGAQMGRADVPDQRAARDVAVKRWNTGRSVAAAVLLLVAPLLPWNLSFGVGVPHSNGLVFALLATVTVLSLLAVAVLRDSNRLRLALNVPYLLLVAGFVVFDVVQTVRYGGSAGVPGGIGPGAWLGLAGAMLSGYPALPRPADGGSFGKWLLCARAVGYASMISATLSVLFNLFWRVKAALPGSAGFGAQNVAVIATAVVYGVVALAAVVVAARWLLNVTSNSAQLAGVALGACTLLAGVVVWALPVGRDIDGFHGVAQNTSTAGVGFEGYLAWVAAAAMFAPLTLLRFSRTPRSDRGVWRAAARKGLALIALWCVASVVMRATDVAVAAVLHLSRSPYDSAAMAAFDVVTAVLAVWLRVNVVNRSVPVAVVSALSGVLLVFTIVRIVVGIALAPRFAGTVTDAAAPVYGNNLAQQITSTFDVVLSGLALCLLVAAVTAAHFVQRRPRSGDRDAQPSPTPAGWDAATTQLRTGSPAPGPPPPRIHRSGQQPTSRIGVTAGGQPPRIFRSDSAHADPGAPAPRPAPQRPGGAAPRIHRPQQRPGGGVPPGGQRPR